MILDLLKYYEDSIVQRSPIYPVSSVANEPMLIHGAAKVHTLFTFP